MDLSEHGVVALVRDNKGRFLLLEDAREPMKGYWAPPHGRCEPSDMVQEQSVIREVYEETGLDVIPIKKLWTQQADSKVRLVSFWTVSRVSPEKVVLNTESTAYGWYGVAKALTLNLYPGTRSFFEKVMAKEIKLE